MLAILLSSICTLFHLLQTQVPVKNVVADINLYYSQIILCLKNSESCAVPCERVRLGTCQPVWNNDSELKLIKNHAKLWLHIWSECGRPASGIAFSIKDCTKSAYEKYLCAV